MSDLDPTRANEPVPQIDDDGYPPGGPTTPGGYYPDDPTPPDRRPWIIAGLLGLIVILLLVLLLLKNNDDNTDTAASTTTSSTEATTTSSSTTTTVKATTTTTAPAPTTTAKTVVTVPPATCSAKGQGEAKPGLAAQTVYDAWVRGDKACAAALMTPTALAELFSRDGTDAHDTFQGCTQEDIPDPHTDCAFSYEGGATSYLMNFSDADGWQIYDITQIAD